MKKKNNLRILENNLLKFKLEYRKIPFYLKNRTTKPKEILGINLSDLRLFNKLNFSLFPKDINELFLIFKNTEYNEIETLVLIHLENFSISELIKYKKNLIKFSFYINNWWHCDNLSRIYSKILDIDKDFLIDICKLNKLKNPWQKRLSLTSIYFYSRYRKNFIKFSISKKLIEKTFQVKDLYVQKAIGWTIREMSNIYLEETIIFIKLNINKFSKYNFSSAIEKLSLKQKEELKNWRKNFKI